MGIYTNRENDCSYRYQGFHICSWDFMVEIRYSTLREVGYWYQR